MTTQDKITYSEVQLERCEAMVKMFTKRFNEGTHNFTSERQAHILKEWNQAIIDHKEEIVKQTKKLN